MKKVVSINNLPKPSSPYSYCVRAGDLVFTAGLVGIDPTTSKPRSDSIRDQTEQALENLKDVLVAAGSSLDNVVKTTVFISDLKDFEEMNKIYAKTFPNNPPARSTVQVALVGGLKIEIEAVATTS